MWHSNDPAHSGDERTLSELDHARLKALQPSHAPDWQDWLDLADLMPSRQIEPDLVTMRTELLLQDPESGLGRRLVLSYPQEASPEQGHISVLSPLGRVLLGQRVGAEVHWQPPRGPSQRGRIAAILYQPEAAGDFLR